MIFILHAQTSKLLIYISDINIHHSV